MERRLLIFCAVLIGLSLVGFVAYRHATAGIKVTVANHGILAMKNVSLHVTGRSYKIPDIAPGSQVSQRVFPTGDSHLEIKFTDENNSPMCLRVDCYFENGYRGQMRVYVKDKVIESVEENVKIY